VEWESLFSFTPSFFFFLGVKKLLIFEKIPKFLQIIQLVGSKLPSTVLGHLLGFLGFGTSSVCDWLVLWKTKEGKKKKQKKTKDEEKIWDIPSA